jgi:hypothetical protein
MSGFTSHIPFSRTPPHGPLRIVFGQFIGQDMPVFDRAQSPHIWQSNKNPFRPASIAVIGLSSRLPNTLVIPRKVAKISGLTLL